MPVVTRTNECVRGRRRRCSSELHWVELVTEVLVKRFAHELGHRDSPSRRSPVDPFTLFLGEIDLGPCRADVHRRQTSPTLRDQHSRFSPKVTSSVSHETPTPLATMMEV